MLVLGLLTGGKAEKREAGDRDKTCVRRSVPLRQRLSFSTLYFGQYRYVSLLPTPCTHSERFFSDSCCGVVLPT